MSEPKIAGTSPILFKAEKDKNYAWCSCGNSENQPFCNGAHKGSEFNPRIFSESEEKQVALCMCKQTSNPPYCDGSHAKL